jgi:hypothetical protein
MDQVRQQQRTWRIFMKNTINARLVLSFGLLSLAGAGAVVAAQPAVDAQEQARILLSGPSLSGARPSTTATTATSATLDAQEQGREMIVGRPAVNTPAARVEGHRSSGATVPGERKAAVDPLERAREMILGSQSRANPAKTRLAGKAG